MLKKSDKKFIIRLLLFIILGIIVVVKIDYFGTFLSNLLRFLAPLFIGIALALFVNRPIEFLKKQFRKISYFNNEKAKIPATIISYLIMIGIIISLFVIMIPQLIDSFSEFISKFDIYSRTFNNTANQITDWLTQYNIDAQIISNISDKSLEFVGSVIQTLPAILSKAVSSFLSATAAFLLGIIISIYIMFDKKRIKRQFIRTAAALIRPQNHSRFRHIANVVQSTFSTYIYTQITESIILGIMFFAGTTIFKFPYALIISVLNGLSVLIPILGAWLGAVFGGLIVLFTKTEMIVGYIILVFVLQTIESNIIYPRRVNDSVGLPQVWVLVAITLGGGLFGIVGALLAVPVASICYALLSESVAKKEMERRLERNKSFIKKSEKIQDDTALADEDSIEHKP